SRPQVRPRNCPSWNCPTAASSARSSRCWPCAPRNSPTLQRCALSAISSPRPCRPRRTGPCRWKGDMPIIVIWNTLAAPLAPTLKRILGDMAFASELLQKGLTKRWEDAEKAEMLTRAYPVFRFTDEAVSAYVTRAQLGMALSGPPPGWGERLSGLG